MILLHAEVRGEASEEASDFEGHEVRVVLPQRMSDDERELVGRMVERIRDEEE